MKDNPTVCQANTRVKTWAYSGFQVRGREVRGLGDALTEYAYVKIVELPSSKIMRSGDLVGGSRTSWRVCGKAFRSGSLRTLHGLQLDCSADRPSRMFSVTTRNERGSLYGARLSFTLHRLAPCTLHLAFVSLRDDCIIICVPVHIF